MLSAAVGYLNGKISIGGISFEELETFFVRENPIQPDGTTHSYPDPETSEIIDIFAQEVTESFVRNGEDISTQRLIQTIFNFGFQIATGQASASSIAKLAGLSEDELEEIYIDFINKRPKGNIH